MTNNELITIKNYSKYINDIIIREISDRRNAVLKGLYSETKLEDEKILSHEKPQEYYRFDFMNISIYPFFEKSTKKYVVRCENWQPKPNKKVGDINVYRGLASFGYKDTLEEILFTFEFVVQEFIKQKINKIGALF